MPAPLIAWGALAVAGVWGVGWASRGVGDAAESGAKLAKFALVGGGLFVSYKALKSAGAIK